jgi:hypothetical protein
MLRFISSRGACLSLIGVVAIFVLAGCGRSSGSLSGKVKFKNQLLTGGNVSFVSIDGGQSYASAIGEDGRYMIPKLSGGEYKVVVETKSLLGQSGDGAAARPSSIPKGKFGPPPDAKIPEGYTPSDPAAMASMRAKNLYMFIPEKYGNLDTTDLVYEFKGGDQTWDIELK